MPFNNINKTLKKVNRTVHTVNKTQNTMRNMGNQVKARQQQRAQESAWKCACGQLNQSAFCGTCGKAPVMCPMCNIIIETQFCPDCGTPVETE